MTSDDRLVASAVWWSFNGVDQGTCLSRHTVTNTQSDRSEENLQPRAHHSSEESRIADTLERRAHPVSRADERGDRFQRFESLAGVEHDRLGVRIEPAGVDELAQDGDGHPAGRLGGHPRPTR